MGPAFDGSISFVGFLQRLLDAGIPVRHTGPNASILRICSCLSGNALRWANESQEIVAIYNEACDSRATKKDHDQFLNSFAAAFPGPKAVRAREEKAKREAEEKAARKIARTLAREVFRQAEEEAERQAEEAELRAIARANRKAERKAQRQAEKAALKAIAKANRKAERQANREAKRVAEKEAEIQQLETSMLQVNEVSYAPDPTPVSAPMEASFQEVSDQEHVVVMAMETEDLEPIEEVIASGSSTWATAEITTPAAEEDFYGREQLPCSMAYLLPSLSAMDTSLDVDFNTFNTESLAIAMPRRKTFLSPFRGLALRQSLGNWARASKPSKTVVAVRDIEKEAIEKASNIEVYGREQVVSTCSIEKSVVTLDTVVIEAIMEPMEKPIVKAIEQPVRPCFSASFSYTTPWISAIFLHGMLHGVLQLSTLLLANEKRPFEAKYKGRPKVKIKAAVLHQG